MLRSIQQFMYGRNGVDQLSWVLVGLGLLLNVIGSFTGLTVLSLLAYVPLVLALWRMFSKNIDKRRAENQRLLAFWKRLQDHDHRYFACPNCKQTVRVPRGKGKVNIRCPKCGEKFQKKT
jgi:DNA-directed RNA polymerase subunit RPC12/RpoP